MSKTNIKCPRCNSDKLYKFGMNKQAKQKYQCKQCKRQFAIGDGDGRPKLNNPNVLDAVRELTYIIHINITIAISAITRSVIT